MYGVNKLGKRTTLETAALEVMKPNLIQFTTYFLGSVLGFTASWLSVEMATVVLVHSFLSPVTVRTVPAITEHPVVDRLIVLSG